MAKYDPAKAYDDLCYRELAELAKHPDNKMLRCAAQCALERRNYAKLTEKYRGDREATLAFWERFEWKHDKRWKKYFAYRVARGDYKEVLGF